MFSKILNMQTKCYEKVSIGYQNHIYSAVKIYAIIPAMSNQSISCKRKRLADTVDNIGCLFEELNCYDKSNPVLSPNLTLQLKNIYTAPVNELDNANSKITEAISYLESIQKLISYEKNRRAKQDDIKQKEEIMARRKLAKSNRDSKSIRELPQFDDNSDITQ